MANEAIKEEILEVEEIEKTNTLPLPANRRNSVSRQCGYMKFQLPWGITKIPNTPAHIEGIMNLRGRLVSVVDFRKKFGFEFKGHDEDTRIVIVECGGYPTGIIVDSVEEVMKIPDEKVQKLPEGVATAVSQEYITGVGMLDNRLIILLDIDRVLTKSDLSELEAARQTIEYMQASQKTEARGKDTETRQTKTKETKRRVETGK